MKRDIYTKKREKNPNIQSTHHFASIKVENIIIISQLPVCSDFTFSNYFDASCPHNFIPNLVSPRKYDISKFQVICKR